MINSGMFMDMRTDMRTGTEEGSIPTVTVMVMVTAMVMVTIMGMATAITKNTSMIRISAMVTTNTLWTLNQTTISSMKR
jgi:hypothetical protein